MDAKTRQAIEQVGTLVERTTKEPSKQPRFAKEAGGYGGFLPLRLLAEMEPPDYAANSMRRDQWLRAVWRLEPHLAGIINAVVLVDSNRGWTLTGGRNQVRRYTAMLHNADGGMGWRHFFRKASLSYWCTDLGAIVEWGRDGANGPLRALYHVDSARCYLTGNPDYPLAYNPPRGPRQEWRASDFYRCASLPSDDEAFYGLGFCAVSRALELLRLLYAVMLHDQEQVAARAPKGLLLLQGISETQWLQSLQARKEEQDSLGRQYYGGVQVLASMGIEQVDAKLVALSQLPQNFDAEKFMNLAMYGYALCFGYDPREFWPVSAGTLGTARETEAQALKASGKGGMDFPLSFQEGFQRELPPTLAYEFEQRDDEGELQASNVQKAKLDVAATAYQAGLMQGAPLLSREEARILLAQAGVIPPEWTQTEEDITASDTEGIESEEEEVAPNNQEAQRALDSDPVRRAMHVFPREPIERHYWPTKRVQTLWIPRAHVWPVSREVKVLYEDGDVKITDADVRKAIRAGKQRLGEEFAELLTAPVIEG